MKTQRATLVCILSFLVGAPPAGADMLLDYRDPAFLSGNPFYSKAESDEIAAALAKAPNGLASNLKNFVLRGDATGAFTASGATERVYLVQEDAAVAIEPFPDAAAPFLVVMRDDEPVRFYALDGGVQYQRLVAAADVDGDGTDEVFLETSFTNMGQTTMSLDVASLRDGGKTEILQTLSEVFFDGCENPVGARERRASTIILGPRVTSESFSETCAQ